MNPYAPPVPLRQSAPAKSRPAARPLPPGPQQSRVGMSKSSTSPVAVPDLWVGAQQPMPQRSLSKSFNSALPAPPPVPKRPAEVPYSNTTRGGSPNVPQRPVERPVVKRPISREQRKFRSFGVSLQSIMVAQQSLAPNDPLPIVFSTLLSMLLQNNGLVSEGIFRLSASLGEVNRLKASLDKGAFEVQYIGDPNAPACALKQWVGELSPPLIDESFATILLEPLRRDPKCSQNSLLAALDQLPIPNRNLLKALLDLLHRVLDHAETNRMTPSSLSIVWSPNIFGQARGGLAANANPFAFMADTADQSAWMMRILGM